MAVRRAEVEALWRQFKGAGDPGARMRLIEAYRPLVRQVALRLKDKLPHTLDLNELVSAGVVGLIQALDKYEPERGVLFETYCSNRIRGAILDDLRANDWIPRSVRTKAHRIERARRELAFDLSREPSEGEIASHLGLTEVEYEQLLDEAEFHELHSIEAAQSDEMEDREVLRVEVIEDRSAVRPLDALAAADVRRVVRKYLKGRARAVVEGLYFQNKGLRELGETLGLTESRVCQVHRRAIARLRRKVGRSLGDEGARAAA